MRRRTPHKIDLGALEDGRSLVLLFPTPGRRYLVLRPLLFFGMFAGPLEVESSPLGACPARAAGLECRLDHSARILAMSRITTRAPWLSALENSCGMPGPMSPEMSARIWLRSLARSRVIALV